MNICFSRSNNVLTYRFLMKFMNFWTKASGIDAESARESENTTRTIRKPSNYVKFRIKPQMGKPGKLM